MSYTDLREWISKVDELGELKVLEGAHWDLEIGVVTEEVMRRRGPSVLFDHIVGSPPGYRVLVNALGAQKRMALTLGLPGEVGIRELLSQWREKSSALKPIPPKFVEVGPVLEHTFFDDDIDLFKFPTPKWHELDGGRAWYTGLGHTEASYADPLFLKHLLGGILFASGATRQVTVTATQPQMASI